MGKSKRPINLPIYNIVRYRDGKYDCIWDSGITLRNALKICKVLNEDYHRNYGEYVVEDDCGNKIEEFEV